MTITATGKTTSTQTNSNEGVAMTIAAVAPSPAALNFEALAARVIRATTTFATARSRGPLAPPGMLHLRKDPPKMQG